MLRHPCYHPSVFAQAPLDYSNRLAVRHPAGVVPVAFAVKPVRMKVTIRGQVASTVGYVQAPAFVSGAKVQLPSANRTEPLYGAVTAYLKAGIELRGRDKQAIQPFRVRLNFHPLDLPCTGVSLGACCWPITPTRLWEAMTAT